MASYTIGPKIGLDGEKEFRKQLNSINENLRTLESELKKTASEFDGNADSEEALVKQNAILNKEIDQQEKKIEEVKKALEFSKKEYGENADQTLKWQRILNNAETDLNNLKNQIKRNDSAIEQMASSAKETSDSFDKMGNSAENASTKTEKLGKVAGGLKTGLKLASGAVAGVVGAAAGGVAAINSITESTREYREDMGKLETAFKSAGISQEVATDTYKHFFSVLGEEDRSVEAVNHLAKLTTNQKDLDKWTNICAGVWGTFGDSLPIEGLTEAANETAKVGQVTGPLADALNWAGVSEDDFNESLKACSSEQERAALITNTLNNLYSDAAKNYRDTNGAIIDARLAQSELTDATAKLGGALEPVSTGFKLIGADMINAIVPGVELIGEGLTGALNGSTESAAKLGEGIAAMATSLIEQVDELLPIVTEVLNTLIPKLLESLVNSLPSIIESGTSILFSLVDGILGALPELLQAALNIIVYLAQALAEYIPELIPTIVDVILEIVDVLTAPDTLSNLIMAAVEIILAIAEGLVDAMPRLMEAVPLIISNLVAALIKLIPEIIPVAIRILTVLAQQLINYIGLLLTAVPKIISALFGGLAKVGQSAKEWGKDFIQNIIDGILSMIRKVTNAVKKIANTISSFLHFSVPDKGPLVDVPNWMPDMIDELTKGIYANEGKLKKAAGSLAGNITLGFGDNSNILDVGGGTSEIVLNAPLILDGKIIANNTQKYITSQQTAYSMSRRVANV